MDKQVEIERTMLDGRYAEKHTSYVEHTDPCPGDKIVEVFAEEKRPLHLEKRIVQKHKNIVAEERVEYIKEGEVVEVEIKAIEPQIQMQLREHIGIANHAKFSDGEYVTKKELGPIVSDAVVAGIASLLENMEVSQQSEQEVPVHESQYVAQQQLAEHVNNSKNNDTIVNMVLLGLIIVQCGFGFWVFFM